MGVRQTDQLAGSTSSHPADALHSDFEAEASKLRWERAYSPWDWKSRSTERWEVVCCMRTVNGFKCQIAHRENTLSFGETRKKAAAAALRKRCSQIEEAQRSEADEVDATSKSAGLTQKTQDIPS